MANTQKYLNHLLQSVGITPACSEEERAAAEEIASIFSNHGFEPEIQEFTSSSSPRLVRAVLCLLMFIGVVLMVVGGVVGAVGTLLVIICGVLFMLERFGRIRFPRIGAGGLSQNVIAYHKAAGPLASPRNRPVVVVAHYDSPRADFLAQMPFSPYRPILVKLLPFAMAIPVAVAVVRLLPIPEVAKLILWLVALIISLVPLVIGVSVLLNRYVLPYTSGAVCNKSSVAAMLGVMDAVSPFKGSKEFPEDVPFAAFMAEQRREFNDAFMEAAAANGQAPIIERGESDGTTDEDVFTEEEPEEEFAYGLEAAEDEVADEEDDVVVPLTGVTVQMPVVQVSEDDELVANDGVEAALESLDAEPAPIEDEDEADVEEELDVEPEPVEEEELPVNDAGCIRYGLDAIRGLGMVAESTVIEYEPNAMPKPKPKAVLNFPIRKAAPKPEPAPEPKPEPKPEAAAPRAIADIPMPVVEAAPVAAAAAAAVASQVAAAVDEVSEPEEAYEEKDVFESDAMSAEVATEDEYLEDDQDLEPAEYAEDEYDAEDEQDVDAYDDSYEMIDEEEDDEAAEEYLEDEDYEEDSWEDDIDIPMEAVFEAIEDDDELTDKDEDEAESEILPEGDEYVADDYADDELVEDDTEAAFEDDEQDVAFDEESDELDGYDDVQEAIFDEVDDEDEVETDDEELTDEVAPVEGADVAFEEDVADEEMLEEEVPAEAEEQVEDQQVEPALEESVSDDDDLTAFASIYQSALFTEPVAGYEDEFASEPEAAMEEIPMEDEFQGAVEASYEPESTAVMEHIPFEQQEDGSWAIGVSDDAEAIEPGATAVMSALVESYEDEEPVDSYDGEIAEDDAEVDATAPAPEFEGELELEPESDGEIVEDEASVEDEPAVKDEPLEDAPSDERIDAAYESPSFDDVSFDESMFDVEPLADDLDIMEAIFEPVDDDESEGDIDEDEIIISDTEITVPEETSIDHTVEFAAAADAAEEVSEGTETAVEDETFAIDDDVVEESEVDEYIETEETEPAYDEFDEEVASVDEGFVEDAAAFEAEDELPVEQEDEYIPEPEPVQHQVREIPNLPTLDQAQVPQTSVEPQPEAPLTGETRLFDMSTAIDSTVPVPGVEPRRVETVDSIMNEIEHDVPQRRQRSIKLPDISATTGAAPARSRSSLLDLPDPTPSASGQLWTGGVTDTSARAKGGTMQFSVVSSDDAPKPSTGKFKTISAPTPRKAKKKRGLGGLFGRKKKRDENSMSEWLGVDEDYDAKNSGRNIGSWDKFEGDDSWKGGAASDGTLTEDELREAVASLGDDELLGHDIWFVATGASENGNAGIREFLDAHRDKLRGVFMINLECVGAGRLAMLTTEGERRVLKGDKRIMGLISRVSSDFHHEIGSVDMPFLDTDAHAAMEMSLRACTLAGVDGASLACSHSQEDISLNVDPANIALAADVVTEVIRRS